jgi:predicted Zn-dependent protease
VHLEELFPAGAPGGTLGIEYNLLLSRTLGGVASARSGLERLSQGHAGDPRYQLALAQLLVRQSDTAQEGVRLLNQLVGRDDIRQEDVDRALGSGLARLGADAPKAILETYLARHPDDTELGALRREQEHRGLERSLLSPEALSRDLAVSQRLLAKYLESASVPAAARSESRRWLKRSRLSLETGNQALATTELRAALEYSRANYEGEIAIARELEAQKTGDEAGELLTSAVHLAPHSTWLCETQLRWLIGHDRADVAVSMLRESGPPCRVSGKTRDALLAQALNERATTEADAGLLDAAMRDLKLAVGLSPREPWTRYHLAELYRGQGNADGGRDLMDEGARLAPQAPDMRYAQALYLSHLEDYAAAFAAVDAIDLAERTDGMNSLHDRMTVALARQRAKKMQLAGDTAGARSTLLEAEPVASRNFERATELAYSWIALHESEHGTALVQPYVDGSATNNAHVMLAWAQVLNSAEDDARLRGVLNQLEGAAEIDGTGRADLAYLERSLGLREVHALEGQAKYTEAGQRLDGLIAAEPEDRQLRIARAELDLMAAHPRSARDLLAPLVAEDPDDLDARLSYVRALTESGDIDLARTQLLAIEAKAPLADEELQISLARRQLALGSAAPALGTLRPLLAAPQPRVDVLMLAGRAELALHHLAQAHEYFNRAASIASGPELLGARRASQEVEDRLESGVTGGLLVWHQPGDPGMSQLDAVTLPSSWSFSRGNDSRFIVRADAVWLDGGHWNTSAQSPLLLGTIQVAPAGAPLRYTSTQQSGLSPGLAYQSNSFHVDVGATPLGFLLPNVVGGIEWSPTWRSVDWTLGVARRAVTSSELSYAGLRDPVTGTEWGGVVQTGPYVGLGIYRENYGISANVHFSEVSGTRIPENQFAAARLSASWKLWAVSEMRLDAGASLTYWNYQLNLSNYTFGSGGYYSPQSYVSLAAPIELPGNRAGWSYRMRVAASYTVSEVSEAAFYPSDVELQEEAAHAPLPPDYSAPYFPGYHSSGFGFSANAAAERALSRTLVVGFALDIDRTNYYHPTSVGFYLRHAFGQWATHEASPPRPIRPYSP